MENISVWWILPFILILLSIAFVPLAAPHFWEKNRNKALISLGLALPVGLFLVTHDSHALIHSLYEYFSFIVLLASLFIISGGVCLRGDLQATPLVNISFLAIGSILANLVGTTGASMLLIRSFLKTNQERKHVAHLPVFFIFAVSNIGGMLTPIGDPPLFLGFLRGVPFFWTFSLIPIWLLAVGYLLILFFIYDSIAYKKETPKALRMDQEHIEPLKLTGRRNFLFLAGVIGCVFLPTPYREIGMISMTLLSLVFSNKIIRSENRFTFHPIIEVAVLFAGIFITMVPALQLLTAHGHEFGINQAYQFYWLTGFLSSFLDNAPTYLTFFSLAQSLPPTESLIANVSEILLKAISAGAVMMGAMTYIGNGPNFMVKAISDEAGIKTPSFFGYMAYALIILVPLFLAISFIFF